MHPVIKQIKEIKKGFLDEPKLLSHLDQKNSNF